MLSITEPRNLARAANTFALRLYRSLPANTNLFFSPISIVAGLAMLLAGAGPGSAEELSAALGVGSRQLEDFGRLLRALQGIDAETLFAALPSNLSWLRNCDGTALRLAVAIWSDKRYPLRESFTVFCHDTFDAPDGAVDFSNPAFLDVINGWVFERTRGRIPNIVSSAPPEARFLVTSAAHFRAYWVNQFDVKDTVAAPFTRADGTRTTVRMMNVEEFFRSRAEDTFSTLRMRYRSPHYDMVFLLPNDCDGLAELEARFDIEAWEAWTDELAMARSTVAIPRFHDESSVDLQTALTKTGLTSLFEPTADFSGITADRCWLGSLLHKASITVDEKGSEASAATAMYGSGGPPPRPTTRFVADHPFVYAIVDRLSGAIVFLGRLADPDALP